MSVRTFVLWLHLVAVSVWIGGMVIVPFVVAPVARRVLGSDAEPFVLSVTRSFQRLSRELVLAILVTGIFNVILAGYPMRFSFGASFIRILSAKVVLFATMAGIQMWASFRPERRAGWPEVVNALLGAVVIYLGLSLRHG